MSFNYTQTQKGAYPAGVAYAPDTPGVYGIFNSQGLCIYIGQSNVSIRQRLQEHARDYSCIGQHQPSVFTYELSMQFYGMPQQRETELIRIYQPVCNRVGVF